MCEHDMPKTVLEVGEMLFKIEKHPLLTSFHYLFERLACQSLHPRELRRFLRLDQPLCCTNLDQKLEDENDINNGENSGGPLPIHRVKALVSMLTPRNHALVHPPPFVEFDLAVDGFACLFAPSLASTSTAQANTANTNDRLFPPMGGLTYMRLELNIDYRVSKNWPISMFLWYIFDLKSISPFNRLIKMATS
jgi:hypothetical protein